MNPELRALLHNMKATAKACAGLSEGAGSLQPANVERLTTIVEQAAKVRDLQRSFYAGNKSVLGECKAAEKALDQLLNGDQATMTF